MAQPTDSSPTPPRGSLVATARSAARLAGEYVMAQHRPAGQDMREKARGDFVTAVDVATEQFLRERIRRDWPDHGVLGEELEPIDLTAEFVWVLDPIDGTSNFGRGLPTFAVSVACLQRGRPVAAAVHCCHEDATYHASLDGGAFRDGEPLRLRAGVLGAGSIVGVQWHRGPRSLAYLDAVTATGTRVRNLGCTVAQLCDVAAGRLDANVQEQGKLWDFAAAAMMVTEAGGRFTSWDGSDIFPIRDLRAEFAAARHHPSIAAGPEIHRQLCTMLGPHLDSVTVPSG